MSSFFRLLKDGSIWLRKLPGRLESPRTQLYRDLSLPLNLFIRALVHSDLSALVISGHPKSEDLALAWASIYNQYLDLSAESETMYILQIRREITLLKSHISETEACVMFLRTVYHKDLVRILNSNGYKDNIPEDDEERISVLVTIENKLPQKKLALAGRQKEYDDYLEAHKNDEVTEAYFTRTLIRLAKYQGVAIIRAKDITVMEFIELMKEYVEYVNTIKANIDGEKG